MQNVLLALKTASNAIGNQPAVIIGFILAVVGPMALLVNGDRGAQGFPWYAWVIGGMSLLVFVLLGFLLFTRDSSNARDISISPNRR